jgi:hypothetical protein
MIGEFLLRLLVALPLVLGVAVLTLVAMRRGWLPMPGRLAEPGRPSLADPDSASARLDLVATRALQPGVRVAVLRWAGQDFLVGVTPQGITLLSPQAAPGQRAPVLEVTP